MSFIPIILADGVLPRCPISSNHRAASDADVAVLLSGQPGKFIETKFAMDDLAYEVLLKTGIRIQPLPIWQSEWD